MEWTIGRKVFCQFMKPLTHSFMKKIVFMTDRKTNCRKQKQWMPKMSCRWILRNSVSCFFTFDAVSFTDDSVIVFSSRWVLELLCATKNMTPNLDFISLAYHRYLNSKPGLHSKTHAEGNLQNAVKILKIFEERLREYFQNWTADKNHSVLVMNSYWL